jgi:D-xylose transport system substrate-binding protein
MESLLDRRRAPRLLAGVAVFGVMGLLAACGSSSHSSSGATTTTAAPSSPTTAAASPTIPAGLSVSSFNSSFSIMPQFRGLTAAGKGMVGVILPDTTSSTRYVDFDAPYLSKAFQLAGYSSTQYKVNNAQGSESTQLADAQADISLGATVLLIDQLSSTVGNEIVNLANQHGVKVIAYDRAIFTGTNTYYVSFDNFEVGKLIGGGFNTCVGAWGVSNPQVFELSGGEDIDANAVSFAQGYNSVIWNKPTTPLPAGTTNSKGWHLVAEQITPGWVNATGGTIFQQQFTAHTNINATVEANDGLANAVITDLKNKGVGPKKIPTTGQDATLQGMENILTNYQCGSVYKPIYKEAQDAVALATIIRANQNPSALINGTTSPPKNTQGTKQPASLLTPTWVTTANMNSTVIADKFIQPAPLCSAVGASVCTAAGITP